MLTTYLFIYLYYANHLSFYIYIAHHLFFHIYLMLTIDFYIPYVDLLLKHFMLITFLLVLGLIIN